jgi:hypothetical protein
VDTQRIRLARATAPVIGAFHRELCRYIGRHDLAGKVQSIVSSLELSAVTGPDVKGTPFTVGSSALSGAALCGAAAIVPEKNIDGAQITTKGETFIIVI